MRREKRRSHTLKASHLTPVHILLGGPAPHPHPPASSPPPPPRSSTPPSASQNHLISSGLCGRFMAQTPEGFSFPSFYFFSLSSPRVKPARRHFISGVSRHSGVNEPRAHTGNIDSRLSLMDEQEKVRSQHGCAKIHYRTQRSSCQPFSWCLFLNCGLRGKNAFWATQGFGCSTSSGRWERFLEPPYCQSAIL